MRHLFHRRNLQRHSTPFDYPFGAICECRIHGESFDLLEDVVGSTTSGHGAGDVVFVEGLFEVGEEGCDVRGVLL